MKESAFWQAFWDGFTLKRLWDWYDRQEEPKRFLLFAVFVVVLLGVMPWFAPACVMAGTLAGLWVMLVLGVLKAARRRD